MINNEVLRKRFANTIQSKWEMNDHNLTDISCVYAMLSFDILSKDIDIAYIGSTTKLFSRYKSHKVPEKIQAMRRINILYYLPMKRGFYDYEIKLIKRLKPLFNKQHKN